MKKLCILCLLTMLLLCALPVTTATAASIVASGNCGAQGDNLTWTLDRDGLLTISGTGEMADYTDGGDDGVGGAPWWPNLTSVVIGDGVTSIGDRAFSFFNSLTSVTIPDSVTSIGTCAFYDCISLTSVTIPDSVTSIGRWAFYRCSLTSVTIPDSVTSIRDGVFCECSSLTSVTMGSGVTSIGDSAFSSCGLTSVTIPDGVTSIGVGAFSGCIGLISVTIPDGVTSIGDGAFNYCTSLTSVTIPDGVTSIGDEVFEDCTSLTEVTIPASVTSIGNYAFYRCGGLTTVYYGGTAEQWADIAVAMGNDPLTAAELICAAPLEINTQPVDYTGAAGSTIRFTVAAEGEGLTYQWYFKRAGETDFNPSTVAAAKKATFSMKMADKYDGWQYYCIVSDACGQTAQSNTVTIHKAPALTITTQPVSYTGVIGGNASFSVEAQGDGLTYQWYYQTATGTTWKVSTADGNQTATLTVPVTSGRNGYKYHCVVKDSYGSSVTSAAATLTARPAVSITTQPVNYTGSAGSTIKFTVQASGDGLSYQWWYRKGSSGSFTKSTLAAGKKATFTMTMADKYDGWQYYCIVSDTYGQTVRSNTVTIHKSTDFAITTLPVDYTGPVDSTITFTVAATGDGLTYQWWYKKTDAASFVKSTLAAGTKATFTMKMAEKYDGWQYYCVVKDASGNSIRTNTVTIHLSQPLQIISLPQDYTGAVGSTIKFTVNATGDDLTYQWWYKKTGSTSFVKSTLASGTKATFTMKMAEKYDGWQYYCVVKDAYGNSLRTNTVTIHLN